MRHTPLIEFHRSQGAKLVDFAGWEMPVYYTGLLEEHHYTRNHATFFDVSHMGRVYFSGADAAAFLERLNTRRIGDMKVGQCRYSHMCRDDGGILDDVIVSRLEENWLVVCNASNREKLLGWWQQQLRGADVAIDDQTTKTAMVAIQGPEALETVDRLLPFPVSDLKRYHFKHGSIMGTSYYIARSGYTGEDGIEVIVPAHMAMMAARLLTSASEEIARPIKPAGLGARDTLRTEAGMPLYGHELSEEWDSITAGQNWAVDLTKDFVGRDALQRAKEAGPPRVIVGLEVDSRRTPRQGATVLADGRPVGTVTSGTTSPTLGKVIAMALVSRESATVGAALQIELRSEQLPARVVALPFYKRGKSG